MQEHLKLYCCMSFSINTSTLYVHTCSCNEHTTVKWYYYKRHNKKDYKWFKRDLFGSIHFFLGKGVVLTSACFKVHSSQNVSQMYRKDVVEASVKYLLGPSECRKFTVTSWTSTYPPLAIIHYLHVSTYAVRINPLGICLDSYCNCFLSVS